MTKKQIARLNELRAQGLGPTRIADNLGISINTVASYIRRHPAPPGMSVCKECGSLIHPAVGKKARLFCSASCKTRWWNKHRTTGNKKLITVTCDYCGEEFTAYESDKRKYCSQSCYHNARKAAGN